MRLVHALLVLGSLFLAACHGQPVVDMTPKPSVGGTIAGIVSTDANTPLANRKVTAVDVKTAKRFDTTTGINGGYTIKVPEGTYHLEVQLQAGEAVAKQPDDTKINNSDLDPHRDFVITVKRAA
jgi:hypothetical protein